MQASGSKPAQQMSPAGSGTLDGTSSPARSGSPAPGSLAKLPPGRPASLSNLAAEAVDRSGPPADEAAMARPGAGPGPSAAPDGAPSAGSMGQPAVLSTSESSNGASQSVSEPRPAAAADTAGMPVDIGNGRASAAAETAGSSAAPPAPLLSYDAPATAAQFAQPAEVLATGPPRSGGAAANMPASVPDRAALSASSAAEGIGAAQADGNLMHGAASGAASAPAARMKAAQGSQAADLSSTVGEHSEVAAPAAGGATIPEQPAAFLSTDGEESGSSAVHVDGVNGASEPDRETADARSEPPAAGMAGPEGKLSAQPAATEHADGSNPPAGPEAEGSVDAAGTEAPQESRVTAKSPAIVADTGPEPAASAASPAVAAPTDDMTETSASNTFDGAAVAEPPGAPEQLQGKLSSNSGAAPAPEPELGHAMQSAGPSQTCLVSTWHPNSSCLRVSSWLWVGVLLEVSVSPCREIQDRWMQAW